MPEKIWRIALVGCGGMATHYRHRYQQIARASLALLVDVDPDAARDAAAQLGVEHWSTEIEDALTPGIDIVDISTPNHLHAAQAIAAVEAGKHVLLQKPLAPTVEDAEAIIAASRRTGRQAGIYMSMFDNPLYYDLKALISSGALGRISAVHCRGAHPGGLNMSAGNWRQSAEKTGGGSFIQLAVHPINMAQWLLDDRIARVAAFSGNLMCPRIGGDDVTSAACEFGSGIQGTLSSAYCAYPFILAVYGSTGYLSVTSDTRLEIRLERAYEGAMIRYTRPGETLHLHFDEDSDALHQRDNPHDQHIAFVRAMQEGRPAPIPAEAGLHDLKVVAAVYQSAKERRFVETT